MSEYEHATKRDQCWDAILKHAFKKREFLLKDVYQQELDGDDGSINYATLRRTARGMQEIGWLKRRSEKAQNWERGVMADLLLAERQMPRIEQLIQEYSVEEIAADEDRLDAAMMASGDDVREIVEAYIAKQSESGEELVEE